MDSGEPEYEYARELRELSIKIRTLVAEERQKAFLSGIKTGFDMRTKIIKIRRELFSYDHKEGDFCKYHGRLKWVFGNLENFEYALQNYVEDSEIIEKLKLYRNNG